MKYKVTFTVEVDQQDIDNQEDELLENRILGAAYHAVSYGDLGAISTVTPIESDK